MAELTTCLQYHNAHRSVNCCLCGRRWDEQWVSVVLLDETRGVGPLCPACLHRCPQETAARLRVYGANLQAMVHELHDAPSTRETAEPPAALETVLTADAHSLCDLAPRFEALKRQSARVCAATRQLLDISTEMRQRNAALRAELLQAQALSRRLIDASQRMRRRAIAGEPASLEWIDEVDVAAVEAEALLDFADRFPRGRSWPTTVHEAIYAERSCFRARRLDLSPQLLRRAVDDRYMRFISECA